VNEVVTSVLALALVALPWVLGGLRPTREDLTLAIILAFAAGLLSIGATVMSAFDWPGSRHPRAPGVRIAISRSPDSSSDLERPVGRVGVEHASEGASTGRVETSTRSEGSGRPHPCPPARSSDAPEVPSAGAQGGFSLGGTVVARYTEERRGAGSLSPSLKEGSAREAFLY
jgi:hypothetical protein